MGFTDCFCTAGDSCGIRHDRLLHRPLLLTFGNLLSCLQNFDELDFETSLGSFDVRFKPEKCLVIITAVANDDEKLQAPPCLVLTTLSWTL